MRIAVIRESVDIAAVVAEAIGVNRLPRKRRQCPFHSPSRYTFYVAPAPRRGRPYAHCVACGWHGDVIRFVADIHRITFDEAVERLGSRSEAGS